MNNAYVLFFAMVVSVILFFVLLVMIAYPYGLILGIILPAAIMLFTVKRIPWYSESVNNGHGRK